jgi:hypothetical protein
LELLLGHGLPSAYRRSLKHHATGTGDVRLDQPGFKGAGDGPGDENNGPGLLLPHELRSEGVERVLRILWRLGRLAGVAMGSSDFPGITGRTSASKVGGTPANRSEVRYLPLLRQLEASCRVLVERSCKAALSCRPRPKSFFCRWLRICPLGRKGDPGPPPCRTPALPFVLLRRLSQAIIISAWDDADSLESERYELAQVGL